MQCEAPHSWVTSLTCDNHNHSLRESDERLSAHGNAPTHLSPILRFYCILLVEDIEDVTLESIAGLAKALNDTLVLLLVWCLVRTCHSTAFGVVKFGCEEEAARGNQQQQTRMDQKHNRR